jgi:hypothetical protein
MSVEIKITLTFNSDEEYEAYKCKEDNMRYLLEVEKKYERVLKAVRENRRVMYNVDTQDLTIEL